MSRDREVLYARLPADTMNKLRQHARSADVTLTHLVAHIVSAYYRSPNLDDRIEATRPTRVTT